VIRRLDVMARHTARGLVGILVASLTACAAPTSTTAQSPASPPPAPVVAAAVTPAPAVPTPAPAPAPARETPTRPAAILWPTTKISGIDYVDVRAIAKAFDLKAEWTKPVGTLTLSDSKGVRFTLEANQKDFYFDRLRVFLGEAALRQKDTLWISKLDVVKIIAPLYRPAAHAALLPAQAPKLLVIDPGHGGIDPGTQNEKLKVNEKTFTLDVAQRLEKLLEARGWQVLLVREKDTELSKDKKADLLMRSEFANRRKADLYLSIHFNSAGPTVSGIETYSLAPQYMLSAGALQPDEMTKVAYPGNRLDYANLLLGESLHRALIGGLKSSDRGYKHARQAVLRMLDCPGALVECAYLSNDAEARRVATPEFRQTIAESLAAGVENYAADLATLRPPPPPEK
jgi:N-acetylmuramoyl-L-alanine amidase